VSTVSVCEQKFSWGNFPPLILFYLVVCFTESNLEHQVYMPVREMRQNFAWHPYLLQKKKPIIAVFLNFRTSVEQWLKLWWHIQHVKHLYASCSIRNQAELFVAFCKNICWVSLSSLMRKHFLLSLRLLYFYLNMKLKSVWCWNIDYKSLESVMG